MSQLPAAATLLAVALGGLATGGPAWAARGHTFQPAQARQRTGSPVDVLYAGSLTTIMEDQLGPAFDKATGDSFVGFSGGSKGLATQIKGRLRQADVFISASPSVNASLEGKANGSWVSSYHTFGFSALVLGYEAADRAGRLLASQPWYRVVTRPGFRLGRTDPAVDPKGQLAVEVLRSAATRYHLPALAADATTTSDVFPEESLVGRLQAGQLDAGFFYTIEAKAAHFPFVRLPGYHYGATYTVAQVNRAPHPGAATRFIAFLHSPTAVHIFEADGLSVTG